MHKLLMIDNDLLHSNFKLFWLSMSAERLNISSSLVKLLSPSFYSYCGLEIANWNARGHFYQLFHVKNRHKCIISNIRFLSLLMVLEKQNWMLWSIFFPHLTAFSSSPSFCLLPLSSLSLFIGKWKWEKKKSSLKRNDVNIVNCKL